MSERSDEILLRGLDDWVQAVDIYWAVKGNDQSMEDRCVAALELIGELLCDGLVEAGDVTEDGFVPWDLGNEAALIEIERRWRELEDHRPHLGDVCWLRLTLFGEEEARKTWPGLDR